MFNSPACINCQFKSSATKFLNNDELGTLERSCAEIEFKKGDIIFKQGVLSSNIVYLKSGIVKFHIEEIGGEKIVKIAKGPIYLGIPTTFDEKYNRYSVTAVDKASACIIGIDVFRQFVQDNGKFAYEIIVELCRNEINLFGKYISRVQKNARGRIAEALLFFSEEIYNKTTFKLTLTRNEFGDYIDTSRESVSRILSEFNIDGIIKIDGKKIEIINKKQLELIRKTG